MNIETKKMTNKYESIRFDVVVANKDRIEVFFESLENLKNFNFQKDRLIIMDCSDNSEDEYNKCKKFIEKLGLSELKFHFYKRRNWSMNQGAQLDYIRLVGEGMIQKSRFSFFMQEHYLNKNKFVKNDTLPDDQVIDLDRIEILLADKKKVFFCARQGFRVSASVPDVNEFYNKNYAEYNDTYHKGSLPTTLAIDGSNFCVDLKFYLSHYQENKELYYLGSGEYDSSLAWEARICKILYDQSLYFYEQKRDIEFKTVEELKNKYPDPCENWQYFYHIPHAYLSCGRDIFSYSQPMFFYYLRKPRQLANMLFCFARNSLFYEKNKEIILLGKSA